MGKLQGLQMVNSSSTAKYGTAAPKLIWDWLNSRQGLTPSPRHIRVVRRLLCATRSTTRPSYCLCTAHDHHGSLTTSSLQAWCCVPHEAPRDPRTVSVQHTTTTAASLHPVYKQHLTTKANKVNSHNNLLTKFADSSRGTNANTWRSLVLALCYSVAEYCCPVWARSAHTDLDLVDVYQNSTITLSPGPYAVHRCPGYQYWWTSSLQL